MSGTSTVSDVRIIVEGIRDVKKICEALEHSALGSDYSASVTSIIPTTNSDLARRAVHGADIVIIATDADSEGASLGRRMEEALSCGSCIIDRMRMPSGQDIEFSDAILIRDAIEKAIVRAGLKALKMLSCPDMGECGPCTCSTGVASAIAEPFACTEAADESDLIEEVNVLKIENQKYESQLRGMESHLNELLIDSYNRYDISEVWDSLFDDPAPPGEELANGAINLSDEVFVSGSFIFAQSLKKIEVFLEEFRKTVQE